MLATGSRQVEDGDREGKGDLYPRLNNKRSLIQAKSGRLVK